MNRWPGISVALVTASLACASGLSVREGVLDAQSVAGMECVAVLPFENHSATPNAGDLVAQEVAATLLTSGRFNAIQPLEATRLLALLAVPTRPTDSVGAAKKLGELLGVQGVLIGSVAEYERQELTSRTAPAEPVVGFVARLVDSTSGKVVWTSATSNFDYQGALALPRTPTTVLRQAAEGTLKELVEARPEVSALGLCAKAYAQLERGERADVSKVAELVQINSTPASAPPMPVVSDLPALPDVGPAPGAEPPLVGKPATGPSGAEPALGLPALLAEPGKSTPAGEPALPALPAEPALPALPGVEPEKQAAPQPGQGPSVPSGAAPSEPASEPALMSAPQEPGASAPGKAPKALLGKLKGPAKMLAQKLYRANRTALPTIFPPKPGAKLAILPVTKKSLDQIGQLLAASPGMRVRVDVYTDVKGKDATEATMAELSKKRSQIMADYLKSKFKIEPERATFQGLGRPKGSAGGKQGNRIEVTVLQYGEAADPGPAKAPKAAGKGLSNPGDSAAAGGAAGTKNKGGKSGKGNKGKGKKRGGR